MQNVVTVLYFIFAVVILTLSMAIIWFYLGQDLYSPPVDILSLETNLYLTIRTRNDYLAADSLKDLFLTSWNLVADTEGSGAITLRNAYTGKWIYFVPDQDGNSQNISVDLRVRQPPSVDPIGWFYMISDEDGVFKLRSAHNSAKYAYSEPFGTDILAFVRIGDTEGRYRLQG